MTGVYLHLFHGRDTVEEDMEDWGYAGPTIGPLRYVHMTYGNDIKFACTRDIAQRFFTEAEVYDFEPYEVEGRIVLIEGLIPLKGKFYGDWSVHGPELL